MVPVPLVQVPPLLRENCQLAPASRPLMERLGLDVIRSLLDRPVSASRLRSGAEGGLVSTVKAAKLERGALALPAASLCRTCTWPVV